MRLHFDCTVPDFVVVGMPIAQLSNETTPIRCVTSVGRIGEIYYILGWVGHLIRLRATSIFKLGLITLVRIF